MLEWLRAPYQVLRDAFALLAGAFLYAVKGRTPDSASQAMIRFFCRTGGRSTDLLTRLVSATGRRARFADRCYDAQRSSLGPA